MKLTNKSYIFLLLFFFSSCVAKKSIIEYKEIIVKDTVNVEVVKTVIKPIKDTLIVTEPCDSLGFLKDFTKEIRTEKAKVVLSNVKGNINVEVNIDSIIDLRKKEFIKNYKSKIEYKEKTVIKYKYPLWLILTTIFSIIFNILLLKSRFF